MNHTMSNGLAAANNQPAKTYTQDTNNFDSATAKLHSKAIANQIAKLALAGHAVIQGDRNDFTVCKYGLTRYCQDFNELQAFAQKLGVK